MRIGGFDAGIRAGSPARGLPGRLRWGWFSPFVASELLCATAVTAPLWSGVTCVCRATFGVYTDVAVVGSFLKTGLVCRAISKWREMKELTGSLLWCRGQRR